MIINFDVGGRVENILKGGASCQACYRKDCVNPQGFIVLLVATCVTDQLNSGFARLRGQPVSLTMDSLGVPSSARTIAGRHVYTWTNTEVDEQQRIRNISYDGTIDARAKYAQALNH